MREWRPLGVMPDVLYVLGAGDTGLASGLFFRPNENAGDLGLFDSRIFASGEEHYKRSTLKMDFNTSKQSGEGDCRRTWTTELCRNGSPPLLMSKVVCIARHLLSPCSYSSHLRHNESRCHVTPVTCHDCHSLWIPVVTEWQLTSGQWSAFNSCGLSGLVIDKTLSYFYA